MMVTERLSETLDTARLIVSITYYAKKKRNIILVPLRSTHYCVHLHYFRNTKLFRRKLTATNQRHTHPYIKSWYLEVDSPRSVHLSLKISPPVHHNLRLFPEVLGVSRPPCSFFPLLLLGNHPLPPICPGSTHSYLKLKFSLQKSRGEAVCNV